MRSIMTAQSFAHIHPNLRHFMNLSDQERIKLMDQQIWVGYKAADNVFETLQHLIEHPKHHRMPNLLIIGDPDSGKTSIARQFHDICDQGVNRNMEPAKPVVLTAAPSRFDERGLYIAILDCFSTSHRHNHPTVKLMWDAVHLLREYQTRMLIIDEIHTLLTVSPMKQRVMMNAIKFYCNELRIPIVGVGSREALRVLHSDPQLASRFYDVICLPLWKLNEEFQRLLEGFEKVLLLKKPSKLHRPKIASILHTISEGKIGNLHRALVECAKDAILTGRERIERASIEERFKAVLTTR